VIINLETLKNIAVIENVTVICRDNIRIKRLETYCEKYGINYVYNESTKGFAENNNLNFLYYLQNFTPKSTDLFLVLNPDIIIDKTSLNKLIQALIEQKEDVIVTGNLFLDREFLFPDDNIRQYPRFADFFKTYLLNDRSKVVDKSQPIQAHLDFWAFGACLLVSCDLYKKLQGFDQKYYLYCEDIDFCQRALLSGVKVEYVDQAKIVHFRRRDSKRFLTPYFFWHVASVFKYSFSKRRKLPKISCIPSTSTDGEVSAGILKEIV